MHNAVDYVRAVVFGIPGMLLVYAANGIFRGLQKVRITLVAAVAGAVLNTIWYLLFIIGFGWGSVWFREWPTPDFVNGLVGG